MSRTPVHDENGPRSDTGPALRKTAATETPWKVTGTAVECGVAVPGRFLCRLTDETRIGEGIGQSSENHLRVGMLVQGVNQTLHEWRLPTFCIHAGRLQNSAFWLSNPCKNSSAFRRKENSTPSSFIPLAQIPFHAPGSLSVHAATLQVASQQDRYSLRHPRDQRQYFHCHPHCWNFFCDVCRLFLKSEGKEGKHEQKSDTDEKSECSTSQDGDCMKRPNRTTIATRNNGGQGVRFMP